MAQEKERRFGSRQADPFAERYIGGLWNNTGYNVGGPDKVMLCLDKIKERPSGAIDHLKGYHVTLTKNGEYWEGVILPDE